MMSAFRRTVASIAVAASAFGIAGTAMTANAGAAASPIGTRAQVPWASVGTGWVAASDDKGGKNHLILVSPTGRPYEIATLAKNESVIDIAPNGQHVMTSDASSPAGLHVRVWDVKSGKVVGNLTVQNTAPQFTKPTGSAINVVTTTGVTRYNLNGKVQASYRTPRNVESFQESPNGMYDATNYYGGGGVDLRLHSTGTVLRHYPTPKSVARCTPIRWVGNTAFEEMCASDTSSSTMSSQIYLQNVAGGAPRQLTFGTYPGDKMNGGFLDLATTSAGPFAIGTPNSDSGVIPVFAMSNGRAVKSFTAPLAADVRRDINITQLVGNYAAYSTFDSIRALYDFKTKHVNYITGAHSIYGGEAGSTAIIGG